LLQLKLDSGRRDVGHGAQSSQLVGRLA